jgi:hypothetical protein
MSDLERCIHQLHDEGIHSVLFKEQWEKCMNCTYDPVNNKRCPGYSPTYYPVGSDVYNKNLNLDIPKLSIA